MDKIPSAFLLYSEHDIKAVLLEVVESTVGGKHFSAGMTNSICQGSAPDIYTDYQLCDLASPAWRSLFYGPLNTDPHTPDTTLVPQFPLQLVPKHPLAKN